MADVTLDQTPAKTAISDSAIIAIAEGDKMKHITKGDLFAPVTGQINGLNGALSQQGLELTNVKEDVSELIAQIGQPNGLATLNELGKVPSSQLGISNITFKGNWNADTNTPFLTEGNGTPGDVYQVSVAGTSDLGDGDISFALNEKVIYGSDEKWVKYYDSPGFTAISIPFSTELPFDKSEVIMEPHTLTEDIVFTSSPVTVLGGGGSGTIIGAGDFTIDFLTGGFTTPSNPNLFSIAPGEKRKIYWRWDGEDKTVIITPVTAAPPPIPVQPEEADLTFSVNQVGTINDIGGGFLQGVDTENMGTDVVMIPEAIDCVIYFQNGGVDTHDTYLGVVPSATPVGFASIIAGVYLPSMGGADPWLGWCDNGTVGFIFPPGTTTIANYYYGVRIVGTVIDVVYSTDAETWNTIDTFTQTRTTDLWIEGYFTGTKKMRNAKYKTL